MQPTDSTVAAAPPAAEPRSGSIRLAYHAVLGIAAGLMSIFTAFAWPFGLAVGIVIGKADADRQRGVASSAGLGAVRVLAVTGGVLAMMVFGAILGGIVAFFVAAAAARSEKLAATASDTERGIARVLFVLTTAATWVLVLLVFRVNIDIRIG